MEQSRSWEANRCSVKKFLAFYGVWRFINTHTSACHLLLPWASLIHCIPHPTFWRPILISSHLRKGLLSCLLLSGLTTKTLYTPILSTMHATCPAHFILPNFIIWKLLGKQYWSLSSSLCSFLHSPVTCCLPQPPIFPSARYSQTPLAYVPLSMWATKFHAHHSKQKYYFAYLNL